MSRLNKSFGYAFKGLKWVFFSQANFRIHVMATVLVVAASIYFDISRTEWIAVLLCVAMVLSAEGINTAIEMLTDLVSPGMQAHAAKIKDTGAAAVLIATVGAVIIGCLIFLPKLQWIMSW